jgi:hypothetical protein
MGADAKPTDETDWAVLVEIRSFGRRNDRCGRNDRIGWNQ